MRPRYAVAQTLILALWAQDWLRKGTRDVPFEGALGELAVDAALLFPPALLVGLIDGRVGEGERRSPGRMVSPVLVVGLAAYIGWMGVSLMALEDITISKPSLGNRLTALVGMEAAFLLEFGFASLLRRTRA